MSDVTIHVPVATARRRGGWSVRALFDSWRARRRARRIFVAIVELADIYPPG